MRVKRCKVVRSIDIHGSFGERKRRDVNPTLAQNGARAGIGSEGLELLKQIAFEERRNPEGAVIFGGDSSRGLCMQEPPQRDQVIGSDQRLVSQKDGDRRSIGLQSREPSHARGDRGTHTELPVFVAHDFDGVRCEHSANSLLLRSQNNDDREKSGFARLFDGVLNQCTPAVGQQLFQAAHTCRAACRQHNRCHR